MAKKGTFAQLNTDPFILTLARLGAVELHQRRLSAKSEGTPVDGIAVGAPALNPLSGPFRVVEHWLCNDRPNRSAVRV